VKKTSKRTVASRKRSPARPRAARAPHRTAHELALAAFADLAKRLGLRWYVFGAQAVNVYGVPRATADLDVTVDLAGRRAVELVAALRKSGFTPRFADAAFIATTHVIPVVHTASSMPIDVVLAGPGLEQLFLDEVHLEKLGRRQIPFLSIEHLIVTKVLAGRPKDVEDVRELLAQRGDEIDVRRIEALLAQIEAALAQRDLRALFRRLRREA
jgi:hypothetical protein